MPGYTPDEFAKFASALGVSPPQAPPPPPAPSAPLPSPPTTSIADQLAAAMRPPQAPAESSDQIPEMLRRPTTPEDIRASNQSVLAARAGGPKFRAQGDNIDLSGMPEYRPRPVSGGTAFERGEKEGFRDGMVETTAAEMRGMPPVAPPVWHAAGWDKSRIPYRPETLKEREDIITARKRIADDMAQAAVESNLVTSARLQQDADESAAMMAQHKQREDERQAYMTDQRQKAERYVDDVAASRIDPNRLYGRADTNTKMAVIAGASLGGFLQGMGVTATNTYMDQINKNIDRDIDAQRSELDSKKFRAVQGMNMLGELRAQFGDQRMAENVLRQGMLQQQKTRLDGIMTREQNKGILAEAEARKNAVDMQLNKLQMELDERAHVNAYMTGGGAPAGGGFKEEDVEKVGKRLQEMKIPEQRAQLQELVGNLPKSGDVPGIGLKYDALEELPGGSRYGMTEEERRNRSNVKMLNLGIQHVLTGAGASDKERKEITAAVNSGTAEGLRYAAHRAQQILDAQSRNVFASENPNAVREYKQRLRELHPGLPSAFGRTPDNALPEEPVDPMVAAATARAAAARAAAPSMPPSAAASRHRKR